MGGVAGRGRGDWSWTVPLLFVPAILACVVQSSSAPAASSLDREHIVDRLMEAQRERFEELTSFSRIQRYTANDRRFGVQAELVVRMTYEKGKGKHFEVISRSGSSTIQTRVFDGLMAAEIDASKQYIRSGSPLNRANYKFQLLGKVAYGGRDCYLLQLEPRRKSENLINGKAWVDATDFEIIHEEGRTGASVSFWLGRPSITEDFVKIGKFWVAKLRHSVSDSFLLGRSELDVWYSDYHITEANQDTIPLQQ